MTVHELPRSSFHHVTTLTGDARPNIFFYCGVLGLQLLDLAVDREDPRICHLAFGPAAAEPIAQEIASS